MLSALAALLMSTEVRPEGSFWSPSAPKRVGVAEFARPFLNGLCDSRRDTGETHFHIHLNHGRSVVSCRTCEFLPAWLRKQPEIGVTPNFSPQHLSKHTGSAGVVQQSRGLHQW